MGGVGGGVQNGGMNIFSRKKGGRRVFSNDERGRHAVSSEEGGFFCCEGDCARA